MTAKCINCELYTDCYSSNHRGNEEVCEDYKEANDIKEPTKEKHTSCKGCDFENSIGEWLCDMCINYDNYTDR